MMKLIRLFKQNFVFIINKCKDFVSIVLKNSYLSKSINNNNIRVINIISYIFLSIIIYLFVWDLKTFKFFQIFIFSIFSFAISMFISDKFKLSNNKFIKILQNFVFINSILVLIGLILYLFDVSIFNTVFCDNDSDSEDANNKEEINKNEEKSLKNKDVAHVTSNIDDKNEEYYSFKIKKDVIDNAMEKGKELFMVGVKDIGPNLGIGAAAGKAAAEAFKHTGGMAPAPRIALVGTSALATAAGTQIGIELGKALIDNKKIENDASKLNEIYEDGKTSPSNFDGGFIQSVLEDSEIPLITMVNGLCYLNYIEFSLILSLFSLLFRKYLNRKLKEFILKLKNKYINNKEVKSKSINDENVSLNKAFNIVDKYTDYLIIYIFICLFWIKFINIYFSSNLAQNIDSFVNVYNHIKNNSFFCLFFNIKIEHIVIKNNLCNKKNINRKFIYLLSKLTEIKFINILMLKLENDSLKINKNPFIIIDLFTIIISILLVFMEVVHLLGSYQITSYFILFEVSWCFSIPITGDSKAITTLQNKSNTEIKHNYQHIQVTVPFKELTEIRFLQVLMLNLKINSLNTILFQYNEYSTFTNLMLGPQVGIVVKDKHDISYYRLLFEYYIEKLESIMSLYMVGTPDFIVIHLKEIIVDDIIKIGQLSKIDLPKRLINVSEIKTNFNNKILPLTLIEKQFGYLLQDSIKAEFLKKIIDKLLYNTLLLNNSEDNKSLLENIKAGLNNIAVQLKDEKIQIDFLKEVIESDTYKVYLSKNKLYLIISYLTNKFDYNRIVFHNKTGKLVFCSKDSFNNDNLIFLNTDTSKYFVREIGNLSVVLNKDSDIELFIKQIDLPAIKYTEHNKIINQDLNVSSVKRSKPIPTKNPKFGVFDIETFIDTSCDGVSYSRVYALGFCTYMGKPSMYYLSDYFDNTPESSNKLVIKCIDAMLKPYYCNYIFYVHNFGKFDAIFLNKILLDYNLSAKPENQYKLVPLYRDNKMIKLEVIKTINNKRIKITFVDSLNILNNSLEKLCNDYCVSIKKGIFPYSFVNKDNLDYIGSTPDSSYYNSNVNIELYNESKVSNWSLKRETLKYLEKDLLSLLEVLEKFQEFLWEDHNIELSEGLTIASLAKTKYMKYYLKDSKIPLINTNNLFQFIYSGYYGGITEVYIPHGKNLTYTDVNSLYPFAALNPMPGLNCKWLESYNSEGLDLSKLFGVFYAKVITNGQYLGLLPVRTKSGLIYPRGKFDGIWTTVELELAKANGYQITVIKGLQFNKQESPFIEYVEELSKQKDTLKGSPRLVVKSLLNNLIGRFALNFVKPITNTVTKTELDYLLATKEIKTFKKINENNFLITYIPIVNKEICESHNLDYHKVILNEKNNKATSNVAVFQDVSIVIATFVTAYARIYMHKIKLAILHGGGKIYYSDTDSIVTDLTIERLKEELGDKIGNKLGQLKLEHLLEEAYFISNKTYILLTYEGQEIKKAKGISPDSLSLSDFKTMYFKSQSVKGEKTSSNIKYNEGSVSFQTTEININWNSFKKREKICDSKLNLWVDTRPLYIDTLTKSITIYKVLNLIKYQNIFN